MRTIKTTREWGISSIFERSCEEISETTQGVSGTIGSKRQLKQYLCEVLGGNKQGSGGGSGVLVHYEQTGRPCPTHARWHSSKHSAHIAIFPRAPLLHTQVGWAMKI